MTGINTNPILRILTEDSEDLRGSIQKKLNRHQQTFLFDRDDLHRIKSLLEALEHLAMTTDASDQEIVDLVKKTRNYPTDVPEGH